MFFPNAGGDCWVPVPGFRGGNGKIYNLTTLAECQEKCINTAECTGVDWIEIGKIVKHICRINKKFGRAPLEPDSKFKLEHFDLDLACINLGQ